MSAPRTIGVILQALVLGSLLYVGLWQLALYRVEPKEGIKLDEISSPTTARIFRYQGY